MNKDNVTWKRDEQDSTHSQKYASIYVATNDDVEAQWKIFKDSFESNRFFNLSDNVFISEYLDQIVNKDEPTILRAGELYYRARINKNSKLPFKIKDLEAPSKEFANYGRLNPKNIPYLYMSEDEMTVLAEVRPYIGANVVIAECKLLEDVKIIDLTINDKNKRTNNFRKKISNLFSVPYSPQDTEREYLPTQYIAEYIKEMKFDGVKYKSAVKKGGYNICLFDVKLVEILGLKEKKIEGIEYLCTE